MGSNLCTQRKSNAARLANDDDTDDEDTSVDGNNSVLELLKPSCLGIGKQKKGMDHQEKKPTLEEWLLRSPAFEAEYSNAGGEQQRRQTPKVCPLTLMCNYERLSSTPRHGFSIDGVMLGGEARGQRSVSPSRSQSGQRKRVSFRLPVEADIHIIYCQDDPEEDAVVGKE